METATQGAADHSSRSSLHFCTVIGAVLCGIELDDLGGLHAVLLDPQPDDDHQFAVRPHVYRELVVLVLGDFERIVQADR